MVKRKGWNFDKAAAAVAANSEYQNRKLSKRLARQSAPKPASATKAPQVGDGLNDLRAALSFNRKAVR